MRAPSARDITRGYMQVLAALRPGERAEFAAEGAQSRSPITHGRVRNAAFRAFGSGGYRTETAGNRITVFRVGGEDGRR